MIFRETKLKGAYLIDIEPIKDKRGFFSRTFCQKELKKHGLNFNIVQSNLSHSKKRGTLRGMHYQKAPHEEEKLVSCIRGKIYDVIIDLRPNSPTYCQWLATELSAENFKMLYVSKGFAHGFQTLSDNTVVIYQMSEFYHPQSERGARWNDPLFGIKWPIKKIVISSKDKRHPLIKK